MTARRNASTSAWRCTSGARCTTPPGNDVSGYRRRNSDTIPLITLAELLPLSGLYDKEPNLGGLPHLSSNLAGDSTSGDLDWVAHMELLRSRLARAQARFKKQADRHHAKRVFDVGNMYSSKCSCMPNYLSPTGHAASSPTNSLAPSWSPSAWARRHIVCSYLLTAEFTRYFMSRN